MPAASARTILVPKAGSADAVSIALASAVPLDVYVEAVVGAVGTFLYVGYDASIGQPDATNIVSNACMIPTGDGARKFRVERGQTLWIAGSVASMFASFHIHDAEDYAALTAAVAAEKSGTAGYGGRGHY